MSEEFRSFDNMHLPPIVPRYNTYLLNSLDDIFLEEIREDNVWGSMHTPIHIYAEEEIKEEISISGESANEESPNDVLLSSSIRNDTWNCPICLDIFEDPVETPCCHNLFCERCIEPVLKCPFCKKLLVRCIPNIPIKRLIQELSVKCRHPQCNKVIKKGYQKKHELNCKNALVPCTHSQYCAKILRKDLKDHLDSKCEYRPVRCNLNCGERMAFKDLPVHLSEYCPNGEVLCIQECGVKLMRKDIKEHTQHVCPYSQVYCPLVDYFGTICGTLCIRRDLKEHQLTCNFREVRCSNIGCKERIMYQYLQDHEEMCKYKIINCPNGCEAIFIRKELDRHRDECELETIECSYKVIGCSWRVQRKGLSEHLDEFVKGHEQLMVKNVSKNNAQIKKLEDDLSEFIEKAKMEFKQLRKVICSQRSMTFDCLDTGFL